MKLNFSALEAATRGPKTEPAEQIVERAKAYSYWLNGRRNTWSVLELTIGAGYTNAFTPNAVIEAAQTIQDYIHETQEKHERWLGEKGEAEQQQGFDVRKQ